MNTSEQPWSLGYDDQSLLHIVLQRLNISQDVYREHFNLINSPDATFIRQVLRWVGTFDERVARAVAAVQHVLGEDTIAPSGDDTLPISASKVADLTKAATITKAANFHGSDIGTRAGSKHGYTIIYDQILFPFLNQKIDFLELGLGPDGPEVGGDVGQISGVSSAEIWLDAFPNARVHGFDIRDFSWVERKHSRFNFTRGDMGSEADLRRLAESVPSFDVIIDDASHAAHHQQLALKILLPKVISGGLYIVQSLQWSPAEIEGRLPVASKTCDVLFDLFYKGNYSTSETLGFTELKNIELMIHSCLLLPFINNSHLSSKVAILRKL